MRAKHLLLLLILAGLAGFGAWKLTATPPAAATPASAGGDEAGGRLAPDLAARGNAAARIEISSGEDSVVLTRDGETWRVQSKGGYPADADKVRKLVTSLSELRTVEAKTAKPERFALLSLQWPDTAGDDPKEGFAPRPTLVRISDADGGAIAAVVLGKPSFDGGTTRQYARLLDAGRCWLVSEKIDAPADAMRWLNARFIELPRESVRRVTITHPDGETLALSRLDKDSDFTVEEIPDNMSLISEGLANQVGYALSFVNFTDVGKADEGDPTGVVTAEFETFDGMTVTLRIIPGGEGGAEDGGWVTASAAGEGGEDLNARFKGWRFRLPTPTIQSLMKRPSDLLEETKSGPQGPEAPGEGDVPTLLRPPGDGGSPAP